MSPLAHTCRHLCKVPTALVRGPLGVKAFLPVLVGWRGFCPLYALWKRAPAGLSGTSLSPEIMSIQAPIPFPQRAVDCATRFSDPQPQFVAMLLAPRRTATSRRGGGRHGVSGCTESATSVVVPRRSTREGRHRSRQRGTITRASRMAWRSLPQADGASGSPHLAPTATRLQDPPHRTEA